DEGEAVNEQDVIELIGPEGRHVEGSQPHEPPLLFRCSPPRRRLRSAAPRRRNLAHYMNI
ncbi:MAG: hypothetical protein WCJ64_18535, partial [Rhodospirillaceae bacterium]